MTGCHSTRECSSHVYRSCTSFARFRAHSRLPGPGAEGAGGGSRKFARLHDSGPRTQACGRSALAIGSLFSFCAARVRPGMFRRYLMPTFGTYFLVVLRESAQQHWPPNHHFDPHRHSHIYIRDRLVSTLRHSYRSRIIRIIHEHRMQYMRAGAVHDNNVQSARRVS